MKKLNNNGQTLLAYKIRVKQYPYVKLKTVKYVEISVS